MSESVVYQTAATSTGDGRNGHSRSVDGVLDVELATPKEMGGQGGATNPEQLFAAGYAACFHSALKGVARAQKVTLTDTAITVEVGLIKRDDGTFGLRAAIEAELPGLEPEQAQALVEAAHQVCPYSNATRGNVEVALSVA
jgi:Ohr subfamily peroxiredoxin